jgi:hypothetical protein
MFGMLLHQWLPEHHLDHESKEVIKLATGLLATMSGLVLALLISSAKSSHDIKSSEVTQMSADFIVLDRLLARYGSEADTARTQLRATLFQGLGSGSTKGELSEVLEFDSQALVDGTNKFFAEIQGLTPHQEFQQSLQAQAMQICTEVGRLRSLMLEQTGGSIPIAFLIVLVFWLALLFATFGLFAPSNATVVGVLALCAISVAGAIFVILELDRPFEGLIQISTQPLRNALQQLGK